MSLIERKSKKELSAKNLYLDLEVFSFLLIESLIKKSSKAKIAEKYITKNEKLPDLQRAPILKILTFKKSFDFESVTMILKKCDRSKNTHPDLKNDSDILKMPQISKKMLVRKNEKVPPIS